jgi:hypothetical protein
VVLHSHFIETLGVLRLIEDEATENLSI